MTCHDVPCSIRHATVVWLVMMPYLCFCVTDVKSSHCRQVREDGKDKNSVVSFTLTDEPQHIDLVTSNSKEEVSYMSVMLPVFALKCHLRPMNQLTAVRVDIDKIVVNDGKSE